MHHGSSSKACQPKHDYEILQCSAEPVTTDIIMVENVNPKDVKFKIKVDILIHK